MDSKQYSSSDNLLKTGDVISLTLTMSDLKLNTTGSKVVIAGKRLCFG
ncbi:MAG: hypothetical protein H0A76_10105 [Candidatus Thiodubiliella endoseptemdiera]|uniref:Uncharacterized protein n=1 Tax=Candidatus Thiodubiliella endoseptemdiera TaxID=2738886 RepID=A0A853F6Q0_9GAMM|nr:hypothetical protein [Candidatus Thiodubiliella endoseptemdiera]